MTFLVAERGALTSRCGRPGDEVSDLWRRVAIVLSNAQLTCSAVLGGRVARAKWSCGAM